MEAKRPVLFWSAVPLVGSLVSSQATVGTAQLAFHYGLAAWWFTLGAGIGCLILGVMYARPLRDSGCITELQIISRSYGAAAGSLGSVLCSTGIFISVLAQVVACSGLAITLFPHIPVWAAALASIIIMCFYVIFGGAWGAGMGDCKAGAVVCSFSGRYGLCSVSQPWDRWDFSELIEQPCGTGLGLVQQSANGVSNLKDTADLADRYGNLVARGAMKDIGSGLSLMLGVLSTQTYAQAVLSAESDRRRNGGVA
ncbi:MAG: sodium:solute symporter family transporter [Acutalibacteraceae bacterium]